MSLAVQVDGSGRIRTRGGRIIVARPGDACCCGARECVCEDYRLQECGPAAGIPVDQRTVCRSAIEYDSTFRVSGSSLVQFNTEFYGPAISAGVFPPTGVFLEAEYEGVTTQVHQCSGVRKQAILTRSWRVFGRRWRRFPDLSIGYETFDIQVQDGPIVFDGDTYCSTLAVGTIGAVGGFLLWYQFQPCGAVVFPPDSLIADFTIYPWIHSPVGNGECVAQYTPGSVLGGPSPFLPYASLGADSESFSEDQVTINTSGTNAAGVSSSSTVEEWKRVLNESGGSQIVRGTARREMEWSHTINVRTGCVPNPCGSALLDFLPGG